MVFKVEILREESKQYSKVFQSLPYGAMRYRRQRADEGEGGAKEEEKGELEDISKEAKVEIVEISKKFDGVLKMEASKMEKEFKNIILKKARFKGE